MSEFRFFSYTDFEFRTNRSENLINLPITPFQPTRHTTTDQISHELNIPYTVFEILVAIIAIIGNLMVIIVFQRERKLRRRTNYYIVSLAMADLLVGSLGVPFAIMASIGMPTNLYACLFTVSLLVVLCTISIFCLVAVSIDRYWAILYPMAYSRNVRTRTAIVIISLCWFAGAVVGFLPLFGWHSEVGPNEACLFVEVMEYNYLVFLYFATIITPALIMLAFYMHIYRVIVKQVQQTVTMDSVGDYNRRSSTAHKRITSPTRGYHGGTMLRVLGAARRRDIKATQNLSIIVLFFMICWIPLYTINCIKAFCPNCSIHPKLTLLCIILSHLNSAVNPVLYAYHLKDFRMAMKSLILKIMGIEVAPRKETFHHRFSLASHHRLQSLDTSLRSSLQPRIYIDSPIWLRQQRQQQQLQQMPNKPQTLPICVGTVTPCIANTIGTIHKTVAAVASVSAEVGHEMWNIVGASSAAELTKNHVQQPNYASNLNDENGGEDIGAEDTGGNQMNYDIRGTSQKPQHILDNLNILYTYDNHNYMINKNGNDYHLNNYDDGADNCDDVFLPRDTTSISKENTDNSYPILTLNISEQLCINENGFQHIHFPTDQNFKYLEETNASISAQLLRSKSSFRIYKPVEPTTPSVYIIETTDRHLSPFIRPRLVLKRDCVSDSSSPQREPPQPTTPPLPPPRTYHNNKRRCSIIDSNTISMEAISNYNNLCYANDINYHTIHHHSSQNFSHFMFSRNTSLREKYNPVKVMKNFIFQPAVKHSSLFHLFQPYNNLKSSTTSQEEQMVSRIEVTTIEIAPQTTTALTPTTTIAAEPVSPTATTPATKPTTQPKIEIEKPRFK